MFAQDVQSVLPEAVQPAPFDMNEKNESKYICPICRKEFKNTEGLIGHMYQGKHISTV